MHFLVHRCARGMQQHLIQTLYKEDLLETLMAERPDVVAARQRAATAAIALQAAATALDSLPADMAAAAAGSGSGGGSADAGISAAVRQQLQLEQRIAASAAVNWAAADNSVSTPPPGAPSHGVQRSAVASLTAAAAVTTAAAGGVPAGYLNFSPLAAGRTAHSGAHRAGSGGPHPPALPPTGEDGPEHHLPLPPPLAASDSPPLGAGRAGGTYGGVLSTAMQKDRHPSMTQAAFMAQVGMGKVQPPQ